MFINSLRYMTTKSQQVADWNFHPGSSKLRNVLVAYSQEDMGNEVQQAVMFALLGRGQGQIREATLEIIDQDGNVWYISRQIGGDVTVLRNGTMVKGDLQSTVVGALLDLDAASAAQSAITPADIFRSFEVLVQKNEIKGKPVRAGAFGASRTSQIAERRRQDIANECANLFQCKPLGNVRTLAKLTAKIEPIYYQISEVVRQKRSLPIQSQELESLSKESAMKLERQVALLIEMAASAAPVTDPANSHGVLNDKLTRISQIIAEHLKACGVTQLPQKLDQVPWDQVFAARAKLEAADKLIQTAEQARSANNDTLKPVFSDTMATVRTVLNKSHQLTAELESCLSSLTIQAEAAKNAIDELKSSSIRGKISNFLKPKSAAGLDSQDHDPVKGLDNIRTSVDFALTKLGELLASTSQSDASHQQCQSVFEQQLERLVSDFSRLRGVWQRTAQMYNLPEQIKFSELIQLACRYADTKRLLEEQSRLKNQLELRHTHINNLEKSVMAYRQVIGSQKDSPLTTPEMVVAEAQNALRYRDHKVDQLNKLKTADRDIELYNRQKQHLASRTKALLQQWAEAFAQFGLTALPVNSSNWITLFQRVKVAEALGELTDETDSTVQMREVFGDATADVPVVFVHAGSDISTSQSVAQLISAAESCTSTTLFLVTTSQKNLFDQFASSGASRAQVVQKNHEPKAVEVRASESREQQAPQPVAKTREDRVRSVMSIFETAKNRNVGR